MLADMYVNRLRAGSISTRGSAEWILETPLGISTGGVGLSNMPNLSTTHFNNAKRNNVTRPRAFQAGRDSTRERRNDR